MLNYNYRNGRLRGVGAVVRTPKMQSLLDGVGLSPETGDVFARRVSALRRGTIASYFAPPVDVEIPPVEEAPPLEEVPPVEDAPVEEVPHVDDAPAGAGPRVKPKPADDSCLFHALADALTGDAMVAQDLREVVAQKFTSNEGEIRAFLENGQTWEDYVARVRDPHFWGGGHRRSQRSGGTLTRTTTLS